MARYYNADILLDFVKKYTPHFDGETTMKNVEAAILCAPTADVVEVNHGQWKQCFEDWRKQIEGDKCSACGFEHYGTCISHYNYCPNCGAKMDKGSDTE